MPFDLAASQSKDLIPLDVDELRQAALEYTKAIGDPETPRILRMKYRERRQLAESLMVKRGFGVHTSAKEDES